MNCKNCGDEIINLLDKEGGHYYVHKVDGLDYCGNTTPLEPTEDPRIHEFESKMNLNNQRIKK